MNAPFRAPPAGFDWKNPDYHAVIVQRLKRLAYIRAADIKDNEPLRIATAAHRLKEAKAHYKLFPADFIDHWGVTFDPRNADEDKPTAVPFLLMPKQREWIKWALGMWRSRKNGITDKSRDAGVSWLAVALGCTLCLFNEGLVIGYGSRLVEYVDKIGFPKALFFKARMFMRGLPEEFTNGWDEKKDAPHMRISFPATKSALTGEGGDNIGRGDRTSLYFIDESAHLERPQLIEAAISQTTNCRIDISSANGMDNPFAQKRFSWASERIFTLHWRDDLRKDDAWYARQKEELDPVTLAQEVDINYLASKTGILIPSEWVQSAIGAAQFLGIPITGNKRGAMDVADEGIDKNSFAVRHGIELVRCDEWSGKGADIFNSVTQSFAIAEEYGLSGFDYDADGLGAGVRGDARVINEARREAGIKPLNVTPFRGSGGVFKPDDSIPTAQPGASRRDKKERTNKDFFANMKAQGYWHLRLRFQRTHRAVEAVKAGGENPYDPDDLISLRRDLPNLTKITMELSQPTYTPNTIGKIVVDKQPDGSRSPNLADGVMIVYAPRKGSMLDYLKEHAE